MEKKDAKVLKKKLELTCDALRQMQSEVREIAYSFKSKRSHTPEQADKVMTQTAIYYKLENLAANIESVANDLKTLI